MTTLTDEELKAMATNRATELAMAKSGQTYIAPSGGGAGREEWMMVPGEHNFLDGLASTTNIKSRTFKNEKGGKGQSVQAAASPSPAVDPAIQKQMEELAEAHRVARGPSLMDQHRSKKKEVSEGSEANEIL